MSFFKAYDMRGTFGVDFDLDTVYRVGRALPQTVAARSGASRSGLRVLVGRDCRATGAAVRDALVSGLADAGAEVTDLGLATTPMVYFFTAEDGFDASVMITASHNPPQDNGLKVSVRGALPMGFDTGLAEVERLVAASTDAVPSSPRAVAVDARYAASALERYVDWQLRAADAASYSGLRYAVDCSNGMASLLASRLFPGAVLLNDRPDGAFPCHSPNPLKEEAREQLARVVREQRLDCGVIFDGDADRAMFVDETGAFVQPDYLIPVVAEAMRGPADGVRPVVIHDVRTSRGALEALRAAGFEPRMVPVGHAFAKVKLREYGALCGGELAGHYYFRAFHGCDSGVLAATRVLSAVARRKAEGTTFSGMMRPIVSRWANSGECNFATEDKDAAIARVLSKAAGLGEETSRSTMDGVRIEYREGWVSMRKSNTEPLLRLLVECDTEARMRSWLAELSGAVVSS